MPTTHVSETPVLIVGAGPAGLVLACELARRGVGFQLVEQRPEPLIASRGKGLQPRTLEVFEEMGILPQILAVSGRYPPMRFMKGETIMAERPFAEDNEPTPDIPYPNMLMCPQWRTEAALRAHLASLGGTIDEGVALSDFTQDETGVTASLEGPDGTVEVRTQFLVGADGGRSTVREVLDLKFPGEVIEGPRYLFGDVDAEGLDPKVWYMWPNPAGMLGLCPLPHTSVFQLMAALSADDEPAYDLESITAFIRARSELPDLKIRSTGWLSSFTPNLRLVDRYRVGRGFVVGDAAHVHPPTGAQGLNTSIQDAYNLGWKLAMVLQGAARGLLDTYEAERRPIAEGMLKLAGDLAGRSMNNQARGRETQQLALSYRGSPLSIDRGDGEGPLAAGDRAPDAPYQLADGTAGRLFEAFQGPHFTLLLFGNAPDPYGLDSQLVRTLRLPAEPSAAAQIYGAKGAAAVLVRPDNYIGLFDRAPTANSAATWFEHCLVG